MHITAVINEKVCVVEEKALVWSLHVVQRLLLRGIAKRAWYRGFALVIELQGIRSDWAGSLPLWELVVVVLIY